MRRTLVISAVIALASMLASCGSTSEAPSTTNAREPVGQSGAEAATDVGGQGDAAKDAEPILQAGGDVPEDFPIPFPPGGKVLSHVKEGLAWNLNLHYEGDRIEEFNAFYEGWVEDNATDVLAESVSESGSLWTVETSAGRAGIRIGVAWDADAGAPITHLGLSPEGDG